MTNTKKRPTINDQQLSLQMQGVSDIYSKMQIELFDSMIRRLKERGNADLAENPYIWQLEKLNDMHMLNEDNLKIIVERTGIAESLLREVIENEGLKVYQDTKQQLEEDLKRSSSGEVRNGVTDVLEAYTQQAISDLNLINSTLPTSIQAVFKSVVEQTVAQVVAGTKTSDRALHDTIMAWQKKGFTGFTDSAGREWRADSYARAIIKTTTYRVYNDMRTRPAEELGIDTFYYSIKSSARAACAPLQGKIVTKGMGRVENGITIYSLLDYGFGTAGGCLGVHCGHYLTPFIIGVNTLPDVPDHLKDLTPEQAEENARIEAKQRALERTIRNHKERLHYAKTLGDSELEMWEKLQIRKNQGKLRALVDNHDFLGRDYSRERFAGSVSNRNQTIVRDKVDATAKAYKEIVDLMGDKAPKSLENYRRMRYNNNEDYAILKDAIYTQEKFNDGTWLDVVNPQKQERHMQSTVKEGKSYFYDWVDTEQLYNQYKQTSTFRRNRGKNTHNHEQIDLPKGLDLGKDVYTGNSINAITIHYGKTGSHLIPTYAKALERDEE